MSKSVHLGSKAFDCRLLVSDLDLKILSHIREINVSKSLFLSVSLDLLAFKDLIIVSSLKLVNLLLSSSDLVPNSIDLCVSGHELRVSSCHLRLKYSDLSLKVLFSHSRLSKVELTDLDSF
jgi:hypothetical protein